MLERLWRDTSQQNSYDPYTCAVKDAYYLECLDIAGARTLGSDATAPEVIGFDGNNELILDMEQGLNASRALHFGADLDCAGKTVGDGVTNAYDLAAIMWYQFRFPPYDMLDTNPSTVVTVQGREGTHLRCGINETRTAWQLDVSDDYCQLGLPPPPPSGRRLLDESGPLDQVEPTAVSTSGPPPSQLPGLPPWLPPALPFEGFPAPPPPAHQSEGAAEHRALSETVKYRMDDMNMQVNVWAQVQGAGRWFRLRAPGVQLVSELYLAGVATSENVELSMEQTPAYNCSSCLPESGEPGLLVLAFARRAEFSSNPAAAAACAAIVPAALQTTAMLGNTIALRQQPPSNACPYDIFLWVPEFPKHGVYLSRIADTDTQKHLIMYGAEARGAALSCGGDIGVLAGSTASDARKGRVQRTTACVQYGQMDPGVLPRPPPPPSPPPSPPPAGPPPPGPPLWPPPWGSA